MMTIFKIVILKAQELLPNKVIERHQLNYETQRVPKSSMSSTVLFAFEKVYFHRCINKEPKWKRHFCVNIENLY